MTYLEDLDRQKRERDREQALKRARLKARDELIRRIRTALPLNHRLEPGYGEVSATLRRFDDRTLREIGRVEVNLVKLAMELGVEVPEILQDAQESCEV